MQDSDKATCTSTCTPQEYLDLFIAQKTLPAAHAPLSGVIGRFIRGVTESDFAKLSDEPGKLLSWVCSPALLESLLGKTPEEAMMHIGFTPTWVRNRLMDGTQHRLVIFPESAGTVATWDNVLELVREYYGEDVYEKALPYHDAIKALGKEYSDLDAVSKGGMSAAEIIRISLLSVAEKHSPGSGLMTVEKFRSLDTETLALADVRAFYHHSVGCNKYFLGTGMNKDGQVELLVPNKLLADIPGLVSVQLEVTMEGLKPFLSDEDVI